PRPGGNVVPGSGSEPGRGAGSTSEPGRGSGSTNDPGRGPGSGSEAARPAPGPRRPDHDQPPPRPAPGPRRPDPAEPERLAGQRSGRGVTEDDAPGAPLTEAIAVKAGAIRAG